MKRLIALLAVGAAVAAVLAVPSGAVDTQGTALRRRRLRGRRLLLHTRLAGLAVRPRGTELRFRHLHPRHLRLPRDDTSCNSHRQRRQGSDEHQLQPGVRRPGPTGGTAERRLPGGHDLHPCSRRRLGARRGRGGVRRRWLRSDRAGQRRRRRFPVRIRRASGPRHGACRPARLRHSARGRPPRAQATRPPTA